MKNDDIELFYCATTNTAQSTDEECKSSNLKKCTIGNGTSNFGDVVVGMPPDLPEKADTLIIVKESDKGTLLMVCKILDVPQLSLYENVKAIGVKFYSKQNLAREDLNMSTIIQSEKVFSF